MDRQNFFPQTTENTALPEDQYLLRFILDFKRNVALKFPLREICAAQNSCRQYPRPSFSSSPPEQSASAKRFLQQVMFS
jgi:hypothetical protein